MLYNPFRDAPTIIMWFCFVIDKNEKVKRTRIRNSTLLLSPTFEKK